MKPTHRRHYSLSAKLTLLFVAMAILFLLLVGGSMGVALRNHLQDNLRPYLAHYLDYIRNDIGTPPDFTKAASIAGQLGITIHIFTGDHHWASDDTPLTLATLERHGRFSQHGSQFEFADHQGRRYLINYQNAYTYVFSLPSPEHRHDWHQAIPLTLLLLILIVLYHATRRLIAPIETIKSGIVRIGEGELDYRLQIERRDELGELAQSINAMADDIRQMLEAKRQLLLAISHELRAPLTRAKLAVEMLDDARQRDEIHHDLNDMDRLIEELLETERLSTRHHVLNRHDIELQALVQELIAESFSDLPFSFDLPPQTLHLNADPARLKLLLKNLLDNALQHTPAGSPPPHLSARISQQEIVITLTDFGVGIPAEHLPHLSEPFYRADPSRQRQTGGYGLGLYLCRVIAEAHGGKLEIDSEEGKGTRVVIRLPA